MSGYAVNLQYQCRAAGLPVPEAEIKFHPTRRWRLDLGWRDRMLAVEVDGGTWIKGGGRHNRAAGYEKDCEKINAAVCRGWRVLRVTTGMVTSGAALTTLEHALTGIEAPGIGIAERVSRAGKGRR